MNDEFDDAMIEAPDTCEDTTEYDNRIEDVSEIEPEEEPEDPRARYQWDQDEQEFARYERSYRARRIRELTLGPAKKGKRTAVAHQNTKLAA